MSALAHMAILTALVSHRAPGEPATPEETPTAPRLPVRQRVFLPPPEVLRQLIPRPPAPVAPRPQVPPPPAEPPKERISIGPPVQARQPEPLILRREDDLTKVARGRPDALPTPQAPAARADAAPSRPESAAATGSADSGLAPRPGSGSLPVGREAAGVRGRAAAPDERPPSIASSLRDLDRRLERADALGLPSGTERQIGPLAFDAQGADFTAWINHFRNEVYRNWNVPEIWLTSEPEARVEIQFVVERDGRLSSLRLLKSSGNVALDRAAEFALRGGRWLPLPPDYGPPRVTFTVVFIYSLRRHS